MREFKIGDKVLCINSMPDLGYRQGEIYEIVNGFADSPVIKNHSENTASYVYANHGQVKPNFTLYKSNRPCYAKWELG